MSTTAPQPAVIDESLNDERWQLVHRIVSSPPFQKSGRLRDLLQYITEQTIRGYAHELTEQHIGEAIFHKPLGYSPLEDSSVRVHARQLRLKLHEYFDGVGRNEPLIIEIPKGSYAPSFRVAKTVETAPMAALIPAVRASVQSHDLAMGAVRSAKLALRQFVRLFAAEQRSGDPCPCHQPAVAVPPDF